MKTVAGMVAARGKVVSRVEYDPKAFLANSGHRKTVMIIEVKY